MANGVNSLDELNKLESDPFGTGGTNTDTTGGAGGTPGGAGGTPGGAGGTPGGAGGTPGGAGGTPGGAGGTPGGAGGTPGGAGGTPGAEKTYNGKSFDQLTKEEHDKLTQQNIDEYNMVNAGRLASDRDKELREEKRTLAQEARTNAEYDRRNSLLQQNTMAKEARDAAEYNRKSEMESLSKMIDQYNNRTTGGGWSNSIMGSVQRTRKVDLRVGGKKVDSIDDVYARLEKLRGTTSGYKTTGQEFDETRQKQFDSMKGTKWTVQTGSLDKNGKFVEDVYDKPKPPAKRGTASKNPLEDIR